MRYIIIVVCHHHALHHPSLCTAPSTVACRCPAVFVHCAVCACTVVVQGARQQGVPRASGGKGVRLRGEAGIGRGLPGIALSLDIADPHYLGHPLLIHDTSPRVLCHRACVLSVIARCHSGQARPVVVRCTDCACVVIVPRCCAPSSCMGRLQHGSPVCTAPSVFVRHLCAIQHRVLRCLCMPHHCVTSLCTIVVCRRHTSGART